MIKLRLTKERVLLTIIEAARKKYEEIYRRLQEQLYRYPATGLFNRYYLLKLGNDFLKSGKFNTIAVVDVRNLHTYNEIFGYETTDKILREIALKIKNFCGENCLIGNLDSGRFWLLTNFEDDKKNQAIQKLEKLIKELTFEEFVIPLNNEEILILLALNIGVAFYPEHGDNITDILIAAELAADRSKKEGINKVKVFEEEQKREIEENIWIEETLRRAIKTGEIEEQIYPNFQLKVGTKDEKISGVEVLLRWKLHRNTYKVITIAEKTGLLNTLFEILVRKAIPIMREAWEINPNIHFGFNISPYQFLKAEQLLNTLRTIKKKTNRVEIEVEITETELLENINIYKTIESIISMGFKLVIDDFGKGYSSFDRLKTLNIYGVKIDRFLVKDITTNEKTYRFIENLVGFLKRMNYKITVEGVEDRKMVDILTKLNVDEIQGFYYSKPVGKEKFLECLKMWGEIKKCEERNKI